MSSAKAAKRTAPLGDAEAQDVIRMALDDETVDRLRAAAEERGLEVAELLILLVVAAADRLDELLGKP